MVLYSQIYTIIEKERRMSYKLKPLTERVARERAAYRDTKPEICTARYKILTEFYTGHPELGAYFAGPRQ
jgi:hypothetical protein